MQCCNKNRYIFGIVIGSLYTLAGLIVFSLTTFSFFVDSFVNAEHKRQFTIKVMVTSLLTVVVSALYIFAIVKKKHKLILPWLIFCAVAVVGSCLFILMAFMAATLFHAADDDYIVLLLVGASVIGIEITVFWFSFLLYRDIRKYNIEELATVAVSYQSGTKDYTLISENPLI